MASIIKKSNWANYGKGLVNIRSILLAVSHLLWAAAEGGPHANVSVSLSYVD